MITLRLAYRRSIARISERRRRAGGDGTCRRPTHSRIWLERLHRRQRRDRREHSLPARAGTGANLGPFFFVEQRACVVDRLGGNVEEQAIARLTEYVTPIVAGRPQLRVLEGESHGPDDRQCNEIVIREKRDRYQDGVHSEIRCELASERHDHRRVPLAQLLRRGLRRRVRCLRRRRVAITYRLGELVTELVTDVALPCPSA